MGDGEALDYAPPKVAGSAGAQATMSLSVMPLVGGKKDEHGCLRSAGYNWCPHSKTCVRSWRDSCPGGTEFCQGYCMLSAQKGTKSGSWKVSCECQDGKALDSAPPKGVES